MGLSLLGVERGVGSLTARNQLGGFPGRMPPTGLGLIKINFSNVGGHASSHRESLPSRDSMRGQIPKFLFALRVFALHSPRRGEKAAYLHRTSVVIYFVREDLAKEV